MSQFHSLAASSGYIEDLLQRFTTDRSAVPEDWRAALSLLDTYFPNLLAGAGGDADEGIKRLAHLAARLDPLDRALPDRWDRLRAEFLRRTQDEAQDEERLAWLLRVYAGHLAIETGHIDDATRIAWIHRARESATPIDPESRRRALAAVVRSETFERFMGHRFAGKKRFGAEGAESLLAVVQRLLDRAAAAGVDEVIVGTMHRGRLSLMAGIFAQPLEQLFLRMKGLYPLAEAHLAADVPYHLGLAAVYQAPSGPIRLTLLPNPSHLEAVNAVVLGYARNRQEVLGSPSRVLPLILHTDASVVAQGVVAEAIQFSAVSGHRVGGAINIVVNNQLGFTTEPEEGRSSRHCTAAWKAIDSLIAHVNANDVDAVLAAADLGFDFRQTFAGESVIDLVCIRANGHNEVDEPRFTQPSYYELAADKRAISAHYGETLAQERVVTSTFIDDTQQLYRSELESAFAAEGTALATDVPSSPAVLGTAASLADIVELASRIPTEGDFNKKAVRLVMQRADEWRTGVSWATAEILALGSILSLGWGVRLTGQDVERGAFSQRHLSLVDEKSGRRRRTYEAAPREWGSFEVINTPLSEYAALSFEYGYSVAADRTLAIWEAQFGDFANGAQTTFDQFIASGAEKWSQRSGLVVLLPHGLEGQGPEHSSGRIERMLQLAAKDNVRIAHPSTPANYYHLLLSQLRQAPRRPLIVFTPKKLLRLKAAVSNHQEFESGGFCPVIASGLKRGVKRVLVCSGKIFYDIQDALSQADDAQVGVIRMEQLYPFPESETAQLLRGAPGAEVVWVQEEPANFGAWTWLRSRWRARWRPAVWGWGHCDICRVPSRPRRRAASTPPTTPIRPPSSPPRSFAPDQH